MAHLRAFRQPGRLLLLIGLSLISQTSAQSTSTSAAPSNTATTVPKTGWNYEGCYTDSVAGRTLAVGMGVAGAMTNAKCQAACRAAGYILAGTEYSGECFCDNQYRNKGGPAPDGEAKCTMLCNGNQTEVCGGPDRLSLFKFYTGRETTSSTTARSTASASAAASAAASTTATASATASSKSSAAPVATGLPNGFKYKGCYVDGPGYRIVNYQQSDDQSMTIASCAKKCADAGYEIAAMEYSYQCFCDNAVSLHNTPCSKTAIANPCRLGWAANLLRLSLNATRSVQASNPRHAEVLTG
jgi:hypothetical protein